MGDARWFAPVGRGVLASTVGWVVEMPLWDIAGPPALGVAYGAITGTTLVWLLRRPALGTADEA